MSAIEKIVDRINRDADHNPDKAIPDALISMGEFRAALAEAYAQALEDYEAQGSYAKRMGRFPDNPYKEDS